MIKKYQKNNIKKFKKKLPNHFKKIKYLYKNQKFKIGIFLNKPQMKQILYPFKLNLKLINETIKK